jgi:hypothetical protein
MRYSNRIYQLPCSGEYKVDELKEYQLHLEKVQKFIQKILDKELLEKKLK